MIRARKGRTERNRGHANDVQGNRQGKKLVENANGKRKFDREEENGDTIDRAITRRATMYSIVDVGGSILEESRVFV